MEYVIWVIIALLLVWIALTGKLGSILGAMIDPGSMIDQSASANNSGGGF